MFKRQKLGVRIIMPVIVMVILFSAALFILGNITSKRMIHANLDNVIDAKIKDIYTSVERVSAKVLSEAALFSRADAVQQAYATAYTGNIADAKEPAMEAARGELRAFFSSLEEGYGHVVKGNFRIHFHLPPARSLLRLWKSKQNKSDDLTSFRNTILTIGKGNHDPIKGIEIGRGGFAIRGLAPVFSDDKKYLGSVEVLSTFDPVVKFSISSKKEYIAVYMNKEFLPIATRLQKPEKNPVVGNEFVFVSSTDKKRTDRVVSAGLLARGKQGTVKERIDDDMVSVFPVKNFNGDQIGVIAFVYNASDLFNSLTTIRWGVALLCLALALGVGIPLVFAVRGVTAPLNRIISALSDSAHQVADASGQVSEASQILAEGATEQAASIEETSASLEEISSVARQNADNSKEANTLMVHTGEVVTRADQSMEELNRSMADINTAGQEISKIIKTIDEIAFQTNLLALNAAVEAARAGEAGAGFAVVADEVRNLALRAAEAARDTSGMIEQTIDRVSKGTDIVNRTNEAFTEVRQSSGKVGELIGNIAGASDEQAQGVEQVNTAVSHMDRVVHQNAASAEESASASRELSSQAEQMKEVVRDLTAIANGRNEKTAAAQAALAASPAKQLPQEARQIRGLPLKKS